MHRRRPRIESLRVRPTLTTGSSRDKAGLAGDRCVSSSDYLDWRKPNDHCSKHPPLAIRLHSYRNRTRLVLSASHPPPGKVAVMMASSNGDGQRAQPQQSQGLPSISSLTNGLPASQRPSTDQLSPESTRDSGTWPQPHSKRESPSPPQAIASTRSMHSRMVLAVWRCWHLRNAWLETHPLSTCNAENEQTC